MSDSHIENKMFANKSADLVEHLEYLISFVSLTAKERKPVMKEIIHF